MQTFKLLKLGKIRKKKCIDGSTVKIMGFPYDHK